MRENYVLDKNRNPVPVTFDEWLHHPNKMQRVAASGVEGEIYVSTMFLGIDHRFDDGPPMIFETMIFGGPHDQWQERCSTWTEAEEMHKRACELAGITP